MRYILNSAVITTPGTYEYRLIETGEAISWLSSEFISTIGYQETADALASIAGRHIPVNRKMIKMEACDEALVFRLTVRLTDPTVKGRINDRNWIIENSEIGILRKLN